MEVERDGLRIWESNCKAMCGLRRVQRSKMCSLARTDLGITELQRSEMLRERERHTALSDTPVRSNSDMQRKTRQSHTTRTQETQTRSIKQKNIKKSSLLQIKRLATHEKDTTSHNHRYTPDLSIRNTDYKSPSTDQRTLRVNRN